MDDSDANEDWVTRLTGTERERDQAIAELRERMGVTWPIKDTSPT